MFSFPYLREVMEIDNYEEFLSLDFVFTQLVTNSLTRQLEIIHFSLAVVSNRGGIQTYPDREVRFFGMKSIFCGSSTTGLGTKK